MRCGLLLGASLLCAALAGQRSDILHLHLHAREHARTHPMLQLQGPVHAASFSVP